MSVTFGTNTGGNTIDGSSSALAAPSATHLKEVCGITANGAYWYDLPDGPRQLWTDFTTYSNYPMVLVTRLSAADQNQYLRTANNVGDLTIANTTAPTQSAKLSDDDINHIIQSGTIRWVIVAEFDNFYMLNAGASWDSFFGRTVSCSYSRGHYVRFAIPSNTPSWIGEAEKVNHDGACGMMHHNDGTGFNWTVGSGIHTNDNTHMGGYTGANANRGTTPAAYTTTTAGNNQWHQPGYVFLSW